MGPLQFLFLRFTSPANLSTGPLFRAHIHSLRTTAAHILSESPWAMRPNLSPQKYMFFVIATLTVTLTIAASTWFLAVALTSASDVTAMYNCQAFFAYAFSIPLLGERFRMDKTFAVCLAIFGVFLMAWATNDDSGSIEAHRRFIGDAVLSLPSPGLLLGYCLRCCIVWTV
jgi:drug/metabolite transporter (DMT)-like permease